MAIRIHHQPTGFSLGAAYVSGAGRRQERRRKYMLDMWQRDRYMNARFGGMGGRLAGGRRALEAPQGRWVDPLDDNPFMEDTPQARVQQNAQTRAQERRRRMGLPDLPKEGPGQDLLPKWQSPEEIAKFIEKEEEWAKLTEKEQEAEIKKKEEWEAKGWQYQDWNGLSDAEKQEKLQTIGIAITGEYKGKPGFDEQQQKNAKAILKSPRLSMDEKFDALQQILNSPTGEAEQSLSEQYGANSGLWDFDKNDWAPEGAEVGGSIVRMPHDGKGNPNLTLYKQLQEAKFNEQNPPHLQAQQKEQEEQTKKNVAELETLRDAQGQARVALSQAKAKKAAAEAKANAAGSELGGVKLTDEEKKANQEAIDVAQEKLDRIQKRMGELEPLLADPFRTVEEGGVGRDVTPQPVAAGMEGDPFAGKPPLVGQSPYQPAPPRAAVEAAAKVPGAQALSNGDILLDGVIHRRRPS